MSAGKAARRYLNAAEIEMGEHSSSFSRRMSDAQVRSVLDALGCRAGLPGLRRLNKLVQGYVRTVPWESASRIVKRRNTTLTTDCPRWPEEFWTDALTRGAGGTCFESNYAFFALLKALGYEGYLTINDMGMTVGCHTAIVINLHDAKYLVDVGLPVYGVLPIKAGAMTRHRSCFHIYTARPDGSGRYQIERSRHPQKNMFTFVDLPVKRDEYELAVANDYGEKGYFLDRVIITKVVKDTIWRFNGGELPYSLEGFDRRGKREIPLPPNGVAGEVARHFGLDKRMVATALSFATPAGV
jgi:arylamine N-acetyltransferase